MAPVLIALIVAAALLIAVIVVIAVLNIPVIKEKIQQRKFAKENKLNTDSKEKFSVVFVDTRRVVDEYIKKQVDNKEAVSMEELEKLCTESPYILADKEGNTVDNLEGIRPDKVDEGVVKFLQDNDGISLID